MVPPRASTAVTVAVPTAPGAVNGPSPVTLKPTATAGLTVTEALAAVPAPAVVALTVTELFFTPAVVPVTLTTIWQLLPAVRVPPLKVIVPDPAVAVTAPPQAPLRPLGVETTRPAGSVFVKEIPAKPAPLLGLVMV